MSGVQSVKQPVLAALQRFTTCDVHRRRTIRLKVPHGGYLSGLRMFTPPTYQRSAIPSPFPPKVFGPAYTVRMVPATDATSPKPARHFADCIPRGAVVFVSQPAGYISACWGGLMSTRARAAGAAGVVVDGRFRDVGEHRDLGMGVFARGTSILGSQGFTRSSELDVPVEYRIDELDGEAVVVRPGDIIMGDEDGVVAVPVEVAEECAKLCEARWNIDEATRRCVEEGEDIGPTILRLRQ